MAASVVYTTFAGQIVSENRGGVVKEYLTDTLGSTIALATTDAITDTWDYWPYGEVMSRTGTTPTPFTFVGVLGYFKDLLDKLFYVRARHYQPNYGRWLTVDPLWPEEAAYGCCDAMPSSRSDPSGLEPCLEPCERWLFWIKFIIAKNLGHSCIKRVENHCSGKILCECTTKCTGTFVIGTGPVPVYTITYCKGSCSKCGFGNDFPSLQLRLNEKDIKTCIAALMQEWGKSVRGSVMMQFDYKLFDR